MKYRVIAAVLVALILAACGDDGVPAVADPHKVVVDGKPMTQSEFLNRYCVNKPQNDTCAAVGKAMREDATRRGVPKGW